MNEAPHPPKSLRKQYGDERQEARLIVDVVRAIVAWNPSLLNTVTFDPLTLPSPPVDRRVTSSTVN